MGTIVEKLNKVLQTKEAIRTSINSKGGTLTESDTFSSYATAIDNIQTGSEENPFQGVVDNHEGDGQPGTSYLFYNYQGTSLDNILKSLDFSKVTNMSRMFYNCSHLTSIPLFDTSNVANMRNMFYNCYKLTSIPQLDTSKVTTMNGMFYNCGDLTSIPQLDTSKVADMSSMFYQCSRLTSIPLFDTSKVTDMSSMFRNCRNFNNVFKLDTSNVVNMGSMFSCCNSLITINSLDTSKVTNMNSVFYQCSRLTSIPQLDTSKVTDMSYMFYQCYELEKIDITKLSNTGSFAGECYSLKTLIIRTMNTIPTLTSSAFTNCYHFYGTTDATYNPEGLKDGAIYVPDDKVEELKVATNWSVFADIIKPLSTLVEE